MKRLWYVNLTVVIVQALGLVAGPLVATGGMNAALPMSIVGLAVLLLLAAAGFLLSYTSRVPFEDLERFCVATVAAVILAISALLAVGFFVNDPRDEAWVAALFCAAVPLTALTVRTEMWGGPWWARLICSLPLGFGVVFGGLLILAGVGHQRAAA